MKGLHDSIHAQYAVAVGLFPSLDYVHEKGTSVLSLAQFHVSRHVGRGREGQAQRVHLDVSEGRSGGNAQCLVVRRRARHAPRARRRRASRVARGCCP